MLYVAQAVAAGLLTTVFAHYQRVYQRAHLGLWAVAYAMLAGYLVCAGTAQLMAQFAPASSATRIVLSGVSLVCAYLHVVLLLSGVWAILRGSAPAPRVLVPLMLIAIGIGLASMLAWAWDEAAARERLMARVGARYAITAIAYLAAASALVMLKTMRRNLGQRLTLIALAFFGFEQANVFAAFLWQWSTGQVLAGATMLGVFDLVGVSMIGLGLTIWLLEDERERALAAQSELDRLRQYDALTGLPNRFQLQNALAELLQQHRLPLAVLFVDLDRFQMVNSSAGALAGDQVLAGMADRLREFDEDVLLIARLEGDEFVLVLEDPDEGESAARLGRRVCDRIARPIETSGLRFDLGASVGVAVSPGDGHDAPTLMRHAELASVRAKQDGGNRVAFFSPDLHRLADARAKRHAQLREAMEHDEFPVYLQPVVAPRSHGLVGFEALVRWQPAGEAVRSPDDFLETMIELGLVVDMDARVLLRAATEVARWRESSGQDLRLAVNVAAASFQHPEFVPNLIQALARSRLPPGALDIEITESTALSDLVGATRTLQSVRKLGVRVALDDFGVGYSSLSQLRDLPVQTLKIDRSFVRDVLLDERDAAIVRALIELAHSLGMEVIAEGVETEAQCRFLESAGVDLMQGFLFARPLALDQAAGWVLGHRAQRMPA